MASELNDFFAKKASKSKKKSNTINVGILGKKLEQAVKLQEELDEIEASEPILDEQNKANDIDSEWIDPTANEMTNLEELGIRDMTASGIDEDEADVEEIEVEPVKTWNSAPKASETTTTEAVVVSTGPTKYQPPWQRSGGRLPGASAKIDLANEEMFPTLAAADQKAKEDKIKIEEQKTDKAEGWTIKGAAKSATPSPLNKEGSGNRYIPPSRRAEGTAGVLSASSPRPTTQVIKTPAANPPPFQPEVEKKPGRYIPPSMRNK